MSSLKERLEYRKISSDGFNTFGAVASVIIKRNYFAKELMQLSYLLHGAESFLRS